MRKKSQEICLLTAEGKKMGSQTVLIGETIPALFLLAGVLSAFRSMMYDESCLTGALLAGCLTILALQISQLSPKVSQGIKGGIYVLSLLSFLGFILFISQGFLDTLNRFMVLWNLRFQTEFEQFSVNSRVVLGSRVFWCLLSVLLAAFVRMLVKRRYTGTTLALVVCALLAGFVLGRQQMWLSVLCLLAGVFGTLIFFTAPARQNGIRGAACLLGMGILIFGILLATGGYEGLSQIARWKAGTAAWFEKFRYGADTLPKGNLEKAQGLLSGEEETLKLHMKEPQEWYLKGFVGADYDKTQWKELPMEAYQGEYEGLLQWLKTKDFSPVAQYAGYHKLEESAQGSDSESVTVEVENTGAYRKYIYLPSSVEKWEGSRSEEKKDWQVRSRKFFGGEEYAFQAVKGVSSADQVLPGEWTQNPSREEEKAYLGAESVYHSFAEEYYMEVGGELKQLLEETFFSEDEERDFNDVTAQIRRVLRRETRYTESPAAVPEGQDFIQWFLKDSKEGNAVHYASTAALAYRTAGYAARYVEGYHYSEEEAEKLSEDGRTTVVLTNQHAHAWTEVYIPGAGWLPVEVVPGMYTEMYTSQVVEGAPSFQVNSSPSEEGLEVEGGLAGQEEPEREREQPPVTLGRILSILLCCLYAGFALYLFLEIQRAVRCLQKRQRMKGRGEQDFIVQYVKDMQQMLVIGKVAGRYDHPMELSGQVEEKIPGISREEYERVIQLIQKVRFGGKKLMPYEIHTLNCFAKSLLHALNQRKGVWGRLKTRYWYAME